MEALKMINHFKPNKSTFLISSMYLLQGADIKVMQVYLVFLIVIRQHTLLIQCFYNIRRVLYHQVQFRLIIETLALKARLKKHLEVATKYHNHSCRLHQSNRIRIMKMRKTSYLLIRRKHQQALIEIIWHQSRQIHFSHQLLRADQTKIAHKYLT